LKIKKYQRIKITIIEITNDERNITRIKDALLLVSRAKPGESEISI